MKDITKWTIDQILKLPDSAFGGLYSIGVDNVQVGAGSSFEISEQTITQDSVLLEVAWEFLGDGIGSDTFRFTMAPQAPATAAANSLNDALLPGVGLTGADPKYMLLAGTQQAQAIRQRRFIRAKGQKLISEMTIVTGTYLMARVIATFGVVPKEVPDWMI